jgi:hypothetical protein
MAAADNPLRVAAGTSERGDGLPGVSIAAHDPRANVGEAPRGARKSWPRCRSAAASVVLEGYGAKPMDP